MGWLDRMALKSKLFLLSGVLLTGLIIVGIIGFQGISQWSDDMTYIGGDRVPLLLTLDALNLERVKIRAETMNVYQYRQYSATEIDEPLKKILDERKISWEIIDKEWTNLNNAKFATEEGKQLMEKLKVSYKAWREAYVDIDKAIADTISNTDSAQQERYFQKYNDQVASAAKVSSEVEDLLTKIGAANIKHTDVVISEAVSTSSFQKTLIFATLLVVIVMSILLAILTIRSITRSIVSGVETISEANAQVLSASNQISASAISLAEGASTQASSVEQVSATIEQSTAVNTQNSENAHEASVLAQGANSAASKGDGKIKQLMVSMTEITDASEQIAKIIKAIDEIAFQTNLLALNAAVEAARAGEHGLGFAVVADEVKNLAGRSANAAKETSGIIEKAIGKIKEGNQIAKETNEAFAEILDKAKKTSDLIGEIAASVKEQSEGMNQISTAMGQIDSITQQNAATSEEAAAASEQMSAQANAMMESVAELGKIVGLTIDLSKLQQSGGVPKPTAKQSPKPIAKKPVAKALPAKASKQTAKKREEEQVFPLEEDDMKEF
ncbi:MAG: methyl-accepting chemotaxis protein [Helicobacteraceae bacterium]|jgi:methyl-accepting chemotaxis protein|nr:methyl-accepting chemotaxis protein [Helicobacteraceae bacterium]